MKDILLTESEIISNWKDNSIIPLVSICCTTYNHEKYIEDAIIGFLIQKTSFPFEIIINDDNSTDMTKNILLKYKNLYPNIIRLNIQKENLYSQNIRVMGQLCKMARGKYIALCEGDDFWSDKNKLSIQTKVMIENPKTNLSFHPANLISSNNSSIISFYGKKIRKFSLIDICNKGGGFLPLASIMMKRETLKKFEIHEKFYNHMLTHFFYQVIGSLEEDILYIPNIMSVYRSMHEGSWSRKVNDNLNEKLNVAYVYINSIVEFKKIINKSQGTVLNKAANIRIYNILSCIEISYEERVSFYNTYKKIMNVKNKLIYFLIIKNDKLYKKIKKIRQYMKN